MSCVMIGQQFSVAGPWNTAFSIILADVQTSIAQTPVGEILSRLLSVTCSHMTQEQAAARLGVCFKVCLVNCFQRGIRSPGGETGSWESLERLFSSGFSKGGKKIDWQDWCFGLVG